MDGSPVDWERSIVIGRKTTAPKVTRSESDVNGTSSPPELFSPLLIYSSASQPFVHSQSIMLFSHPMAYEGPQTRCHPLNHKETHRWHQQGSSRYISSTLCTLSNPLTGILSHRIGTDHQKIAKIDRENEVAPPPKISLTVGKVWTSPTRKWRTF